MGIGKKLSVTAYLGILYFGAFALIFFAFLKQNEVEKSSPVLCKLQQT